MGIQRKIRNPKLFPTGPYVHQEGDIEDVTNDLANLTAADVAFVPAGGLASSNVQLALEEVAALGGGGGGGSGSFLLDDGTASADGVFLFDDGAA